MQETASVQPDAFQHSQWPCDCRCGRSRQREKVFGSVFEPIGANVAVARDAVEGLEAIIKKRPHLVISDIQMLGKDGVGLLREIRALGPDHEGNVPVIAMTGIVSPAERTRLLNAGFQAYLPKPFGPDKLVETILTVLKK